MTTMLEKAARSAWCANPLERGPFNAVQYEYIARAVLMSLRDPDETLSRAVQSTEGWEAMIDAILNEGEPK